jgi:hypothetical protein
MTAKTLPKYVHALTDYLEDDGVTPLQMLQAGMRYFAAKGDIASSMRCAEIAANFRHVKLSAVALQPGLFDVETSTPLGIGGERPAPALVIRWADAADDEATATPAIEGTARAVTRGDDAGAGASDE